MAQKLSVDRQYKKWVVELKSKIQSAQVKAAITVNRELLELYWELGREICEKQKVANWGDGLIEQLAKDLSVAFPGGKGFSRTNLSYIQRWYIFYQPVIVPQVVGELGRNGEVGKVQQAVGQSKRGQKRKVPQVVALLSGDPEKGEIEFVSQLVRQIPWGHNRLIISKCLDVSEALFYVRATIQNNWSRATLAAQLESRLYQRQGRAIDNFSLTLPEPQSELARETLKNPYNFDFLTLGKEARERDLETALTLHIQKFILELGQGFAYMGRQFPLQVGGDDFYLDLLFYHTRLRCYVIMELKADEFRPEYAGKLNFYLNVVNAQLRHPQDQRSIGILLCKTPNKVVVEYALENISSPLGVAEYQIMSAVPDNLKGELPSIEELEQELEAMPGGILGKGRPGEG
jgi:predicted nuclease of restriction endonuclease-like (RecB) superfamily